ncbi:MAG: FMN-binding negative transcriptional regulator [Stenotrophobium sp.]
MSLYTPPLFSGSTDDAAALMRGYPFATLITTTQGEPRITHLPLLWQAGGAHGVLLGHMARANPHWQAFVAGITVAIFHGPHAYISPRWYVNPDREVPTWNYAVVHAHGHPQLIGDEDAKLALIDRTTAEFERAAPQPWTRKVKGERLHAMLGAIVAFRMPLERIEAKFKMNQNRTPGDREQVMAQLRETTHPDLADMAEWMRTHEPANDQA